MKINNSKENYKGFLNEKLNNQVNNASTLINLNSVYDYSLQNQKTKMCSSNNIANDSEKITQKVFEPINPVCNLRNAIPFVNNSPIDKPLNQRRHKTNKKVFSYRLNSKEVEMNKRKDEKMKYFPRITLEKYFELDQNIKIKDQL